MPVTLRLWCPVSRSRGFSLLEAVVASAILLMTSAGVTGVITVSLRADRTEARRQALEQRVKGEVARLSVLPYVLPAASPGPAGFDAEGAGSLLAAVFPHALVDQNTPSAFYDPGTSDARATFTTISERSWGVLRVRCTFVEPDDTARPAPQGDIEGWAIWLRATPPSPAVSVTVRATSAGLHSTSTETTFIVDALRPRVVESMP